MATVWDYDIVLLMISHLNAAMNRYRDGRGGKPGRIFRPNVADILRFGRRGDGSRQAQDMEAVLDRLRSTTIKIVREKESLRLVEAEGLITRYQVLSRTDTNKISCVEIEVPMWIYREVVECDKQAVLTVHSDYFLIDTGIGRFIYRLARRAAGKTHARWSFQKIYERSGSAGTFKKFCQNLRLIIDKDNLPEYALTEERGKMGAMLVMAYRPLSKV